MYCPKCGQERLSTDTSFCSRCGYLLTGTADLLQLGGLIPRLTADSGYQPPSPRNRGLKKGLFIFLLAFLIVPLITVFLIIANIRTPAAAIIVTILLVMGGLLRAAWH